MITAYARQVAPCLGTERFVSFAWNSPRRWVRCVIPQTSSLPVPGTVSQNTRVFTYDFSAARNSLYGFLCSGIPLLFSCASPLYTVSSHRCAWHLPRFASGNVATNAPLRRTCRSQLDCANTAFLACLTSARSSLPWHILRGALGCRHCTEHSERASPGGTELLGACVGASAGRAQAAWNKPHSFSPDPKSCMR